MPHHKTTSEQVLQAILGTSSEPHDYDTIDDSAIYSKGKPTDLMKYTWYHGNISKEQADTALSAQKGNTFFVRHLGKKLILSYRTLGWISHDIIHRSPEGYHLEGKEKVFKSVAEMIHQYKKFPIKGKQVLGKEAALSGIIYILYCCHISLIFMR